MPAPTDKTIEDRRDHLINQLAKCKEQRDEAAAQGLDVKVWDDTIDYVLTCMMEIELDNQS